MKSRVDQASARGIGIPIAVRIGRLLVLGASVSLVQPAQADDPVRDDGGVAVTAQSEVIGLEDAVRGLEADPPPDTKDEGAEGDGSTTSSGEGAATGGDATTGGTGTGTGETGSEATTELRLDINALDEPSGTGESGSGDGTTTGGDATGETTSGAGGTAGGSEADASTTDTSKTETSDGGTTGTGSDGAEATAGSGTTTGEATDTGTVEQAGAGSGTSTGASDATGSTTAGSTDSGSTGTGSTDTTSTDTGGQNIPGSVRTRGPAEDNTTLLIGGGVAGLILVIGIVWLAMRRRTSTSAEGVTAPVETPAPAPKPAAPASRPPLPGPSRPRAILRDLTGATERTEHLLEADFIQIGRAAANTGTGTQSVVVMRKTVGRRHAVIEYRNHTYWLVDQGSLNGSYVNGVRVDGEIALRPGATITLESVEFEFVMPDLDADEFAETLAVDASELAGDVTIAVPPPGAGGAGGKLTDAGPANFMETLVNREAPQQGFRPAAPPASTMDPAVDDSEETTPISAEDRAAALGGLTEGSGTVDFDVFGDADDQPGKGKPEGGLIDRYSKD